MDNVSSPSSSSRTTVGSTIGAEIEIPAIMYRQETSKSRSNTQNRNLQSQQNGNNNDTIATLVRGTVDDDRRRKRFRQRVNKKGLNVGTTSNSGCRTAGKLETNSEVIQQEQKQQETIVDGKVMKAVNDFKDAYWLDILYYIILGIMTQKLMVSTMTRKVPVAGVDEILHMKRSNSKTE
ncbi:unnamed protein product [Onchocerca flexuosa]|uniref:Uncharacterized protein n=1 Tax=Onchocerca flexuosa TaxID=387005 RepID=A0A183HJI8_9BILA|nr:unnamed protein product [Onchocerca flexuosa]